MSIKLMSRVWEANMKTGTHKLVLLAFADHANDEGECWPSIRTVAWKTQLSRRQCQRIIHDLLRHGLLEISIPGGHHRTPTYTVRGDNLSPLEVSGVTPTTLRGDIHGPGVTNATSGVTPMSPEPSVTVIKEPSLNTSEENDDFFDGWKQTTGRYHADDPRRVPSIG